MIVMWEQDMSFASHFKALWWLTPVVPVAFSYVKTKAEVNDIFVAGTSAVESMTVIRLANS